MSREVFRGDDDDGSALGTWLCSSMAVPSCKQMLYLRQPSRRRDNHGGGSASLYLWQYPQPSASTSGAYGPRRKPPMLAGVAEHLLYMHSTACASERDWSAWGQLYTMHCSRLTLERARKLN
eukprot:1145963-Pelagomonas_calceolata.AAC.5